MKKCTKNQGWTNSKQVVTTRRWIGKLFRLSERDSRTIAIEVGMQNGGLASGLAKEMGKAATLGLAPAVFGPLMNITGSILASYWHRKPVPEKERAADEGVLLAH